MKAGLHDHLEALEMKLIDELSTSKNQKNIDAYRETVELVKNQRIKILFESTQFNPREVQNVEVLTLKKVAF